ncbi:MAG TPA: YihY/virulence factor BrkB family protein [Candidatus Limnocylindrales bacterium]|nr:YihY/virulence factor BrkB family protein [Candidatus Limnocylindrales bacterium]
MAEREGSNRRLASVLDVVVATRGRRDLGPLARQLVAAINAHDVLTYATAIAFRILFAVAFLSLTGLAFAGVVHLDGIWRHQLGPGIARIVSPNFYRELDHAVDQVLTTRRWWWLSIGLVLTLWQVSSGVRALMGALDHVYEVQDRRPFWERMAVSVALALGICLGVAVILGILFLLPAGGASALAGAALTIVRYASIAAVLVVLVAGLLRFTTPAHLGLRWVTAGSLLAIVTWLVSSALFGWYLANYAYQAYQQAFGILSLLVVIMTYLYLSSVAFLIGAELDALLVTEAAKQPGRAPRRRPAR